MGPFQGLLHIVIVIRGRALVKGHNNVGRQVFLDGNAFFRGEAVAGAVNVGLEGDAVSVNFAAAAEAEDLEATAVGQNWPRPGHEAVQAAHLLDDVVARPEVEVVGVGQDELRAQLHQISRPQRLDRGLGAHRGKDGRGDDAVRGVETAGPRATFGIGRDQLKLKHSVANFCYIGETV